MGYGDQGHEECLIHMESEDQIATQSQALREYARNAGMDNLNVCWILSDYDVWLRNPYYRGPDVLHPEDHE